MTIAANFLDQAESCAALGSPFTANLCRLFANHLTRQGRVADRLLDWPGDTSSRGASVPLRMAAALHALVLTGRAKQLADFYPPQGDASGQDDFWPTIQRILLAEERFILDWLKSAPQTNEPARSGPLRAGFQQIVALSDRPLVLSEVGASAGLNLNWDHYRLIIGQQKFGPDNAALDLTPQWNGPTPPATTPIIRSRQGCDLNPIDLTDPAQQLRMLAYLWPDQPDRAARMKQAFACISKNPVTVVKADALDWLQRRLSLDHDGATHVIYHSVAWQYLDPSAQAQGNQMIANAGRNATPDTPLARLQMETDGQANGAALTLQIWPGAKIYHLGRADFHGRWVDWTGVQDRT